MCTYLLFQQASFGPAFLKLSDPMNIWSYFSFFLSISQWPVVPMVKNSLISLVLFGKHSMKWLMMADDTTVWEVPYWFRPLYSSSPDGHCLREFAFKKYLLGICHWMKPDPYIWGDWIIQKSEFSRHKYSAQSPILGKCMKIY